MTVLVVLVCLAIGLSSTLLIVKVSAAQQGGAGGARIHDAYEAAFIAGGPGRVVDAALAALHTDGRIVIGGPGIAGVLRPVAHDPVERAVFDVLAAAPHGALHTLRREVMRSPAVQEIGDGLAARGLMLPPGRNTGAAAWGMAQGVICMLAVPFSFVLTFAELFASDGPPVATLLFPVLLAGCVVGFLMANRAGRRVTPAGRSALHAYRSGHGQVHGPAALVALHGVRGLPDRDLRGQLNAAAMPQRGRNQASYHHSTPDSPYIAPVWCAGSSSASGCGSSGCGSGSGGSGCGSGSSGSSCGSSSSSCGSSSSSSCSSSSS
ncbi:TIGR04222 domain-containing membrane protein [Streptomyces sp. NBC_00390]|uniref:TIGR04222 domain-containing membrane protein n=1 Tax=Streptomyces sp. NBC_00390 TaxID=2975736 RepID=UPI002E22626C